MTHPEKAEIAPEGERHPHKGLEPGMAAVRDKYSGSSMEHLWNRLNSMDFINKGMLFAAILLRCFLPFIIVANAPAGQSAVTGIMRHLGLNQEAAKDVSGLSPRCLPPLAPSLARRGSSSSWVASLLRRRCKTSTSGPSNWSREA